MFFKIKKYIAFFLLFFVIGGFAIGALPQPAKAQWATLDIPTIGGNIWEAIKASYDKITKQVLATAFKKSLSTFLNKLAYDSAVYVAAGGSGQKGLVNPFSKKALTNLADSVAGGLIDDLATKSGFAAALGTTSLCEPVDLTVKANLLLSFKKPAEPPVPKCSLTKMKQAAQKSAQDNLLEFNAGFEESEGGLNIILSGVSAEQNFAGTKAQLELSRISDELTPLLADLQEIMGGIAEASIGGGMGADVQRDLIGVSAQEFADSQLDRLHSIEDKLGEYDGTLFTLQENAGKCLGEYSKYGSVCGNGAVSTGEECDVNGPLCITPTSCKITASGGCNVADNSADVGERCDGTDLKGKTCKDLGFVNDSNPTLLKCVSCNFDTSACLKMQSAECNNAELMPSCADFFTAASLTMCYKNASFAIQYVGTILGTVSSYLTQVQEWNAKIESKAFNEVGATDPADIANAFNPEANEMGQFGKIQETLSQKTQDQLEHEKLKTLAEGPCKGVTKPITGEVVTPSAATCATINEALAKSTKGQETFTGTVADAFGVFINTLTSKLMERYFKQGLSMVFDKDGLKECTGPDGKDCKNKDKTEDVLRSGASLGGKAAAEKALGGLLTASIETGGQQDILSILASCPPEQPALNNCIIDEPFRRVIEKQFTVKEAVEAYKKSGGSEGLDPKKPFGYILVGAAMDEPDFKNGYPYRSMLYLRKYRIIPVGWELAAQYIKDIEATKQVHTLENVMDGFDDPNSPFFGLVDPAWVLKSPQVFCARQGPGPELLSSEMQCEKFDNTGQCVSDDYQSRKVSRKEWCADEQTCLEEGESGDCKRYGYCTLEKPSWKLGGTQCDKPFASCEGYTNSITKANYTVLENTLNKADCNQSNVGCQWYCQNAPKMCKGGTRGGQPCDINNDCASIYCSVGTCVNSGLACSYDNDCGSGATGFCSNNNAISCTTATVGTDCGAGKQCILCNAGARACVNGDTPGAACTNNAQCGRGVVDGVCEEGGGVWSCKEENLIADWDMESTSVSDWDDGSLEGCYDAAYSKSTSVVHSGQRSLLLGVNPIDYNGDGSFDNLDFCQGGGQSVTLEVGKTYTLEAWVKSDGGFTNGVIYNPMGPPANVLNFYYINASSDWQHVSQTFTATNTSMSFGFRIPNTSTTAYVDDVKLYEGDRVNLDRDVKKCEAKDAGCNQFIKVQPGTNLIGNSGFEDDALEALTITGVVNGNLNRWHLENNNAANLKAEIKQTTVHSGKNSLYIEMNPGPSDFTQGLWLGDNTTAYSVVSNGFAFNPEKSYTASAWLYVQDAADTDSNSVPDSRVVVGFGDFAGTVTKSETTQLSPQWERISATIPAGNSPKEIRIYPIAGPNPIRFYIDDLQLEEGDAANNYVQYGSSNQAYLNGRRLQCEKQEVGCNLYSPSDGGDPIPAVIKVKDQCPAECAGYAPFHQLPSFFEPTDELVIDYPSLIPPTAKSCSASSMGCEEFTNLDTVASGGEAKEYYTKLRQCAKPGTTTEATFYTWEGSEEAGFQLRAWRLKADGAHPYTTDGFVGCAEVSDPDCRTFYDQNGVTFLEELSSTVFVSADCHPLRKTIQGTRKDCRDSGGRTETPGVGDADIVVCLYDAIPSQGLKCAAAEAGCREYRGSAGNNLRVLLNDDFEDLTSQGWTPSSPSTESLTIGGRSYVLKNSSNSVPVKQIVEAVKSVADLVTQNETYMLEFWAKPKYNPPGVTTTINAKFFGAAGATPLFEPKGIEIIGDWNKYALGPFTFDTRPPAVDESLKIFTREEGGTDAVANDCDGSATNADCNAEFYLDNIVLREITDNPYLIKDSWKTPLSCDLDPTDPAYVSNALEVYLTSTEVGVIDLYNSGGFPNALAGGGTIVIDGEAIKYTDSGGGNLTAPLLRGVHGTTAVAHSKDAIVQLLDEGAQLGCKEYTDRFNQKTYLRSFDNLCGEDKVGCTEMINSYNSRSMYEQTIKGEYIPRDAVEYIVDNPKVYCDASFKGCEKMGQPALGQSGEVSSWGETYLINDPDQYDKIACESAENMCSEFITRSGGTTYFKDPKDALCEYHSSINIEGVITKGWFKKGVIPAALGGLIFYDSDGDAVSDTYAHLECATVAGAWDETKWTYSCPNDQVGCTEYQTPAVSTLQTGNQHVQVNVDNTCLSDTPATTFTGNCNNPAVWYYRFDILESGQYNLNLSTENYGGGAGDPFVDEPGRRHHLKITVDGILKAALDDTSTPVAPQASPGARLTSIPLGSLERGKRIISIEWTNNAGGVGPPAWDSNLQINSLLLSKSAGNNYYNLEQGVDTSSCTGVVDPEKGCVAFYDATNPILNVKSSAISGNAFAPAACQKCSLDAASCSTSSTCKPDSENCCCTNNAAVANPCDSNTILKVRADRQCAEWLACTESEKTTDSKGNIIEMCKKRQACRVAGEGVECDPTGFVSENKQNQTFDDPVAQDVPPHAGVIADANLRSGHFKSGAHWAKSCSATANLSCQVDSDCPGAETCIDRFDYIEGYYPYGKMEQFGSSGVDPIIFEDDFETYQAGVVLPQCAVDAVRTTLCGDAASTIIGTCEVNKKGICLDYWPSGSANATNKEFKFGGQSLLVLKNNTLANPIVSKIISINPSTDYVLSVWVNTKELLQDVVGPNPPSLRIDIPGAGKIFEQIAPEDWTKFIVPFNTALGNINIQIYMVDRGNGIKDGSKAYVDMISLAPVLEIQNPSDPRSLPENYAANATAYSDRSCRIFAKPDALSCKYRERNTGRDIQGWRGFCAEADPKNPEYCLQWWPIDLIKGEDISKF